MKVYKLRTVFELIVYANNENLMYFRGLSDSDYELIPTVGRTAGRTAQSELPRLLLQAFKRQSSCYLSQTPQTEWDWLALAQHHGLATPLMDWSHNPLAAAFFAVEKDTLKDGAVYAFGMDSIKAVDQAKHPDPYKLRRVRIFAPSHITNRILAQQSVFTFHPNPLQEFNCRSLIKFIFDGESRIWLRDELSHLGINRSMLFPDLQGLAESINTLLFDMPKVVQALDKMEKRRKRRSKEANNSLNTDA